jgi:CDP-glucose 4,6-dehydratase
MDFSFWNGKTVFVTGHTGFKGSWLSFWLTQLGAKVVGYSLPPETEPSLFKLLSFGSSFVSHIGDIRDAEKLAKAISDCQPDIVFHLAAQPLVRESYRDPLTTFDSNVMGTANFLAGMRGVESIKAAVIITTDKVYQNNEWEWAYRENEPLGGHDPYSASKACTEIVVSSFRNSFFSGVSSDAPDIASARAGNVIGGGDWSEDRLIPDLIRSLDSEENLVVRNPESTRPWQHVLEPLWGYMFLAQSLYEGKGQFEGAWNFGPIASDNLTVRQLLDSAYDTLRRPPSWKVEQSELNPHEAQQLRLDISKAAVRLGWAPVTNAQQAIEMTLSWYRRLSSGESANDICLEQISGFQKLVVGSI